MHLPCCIIVSNTRNALTKHTFILYYSLVIFTTHIILILLSVIDYSIWLCGLCFSLIWIKILILFPIRVRNDIWNAQISWKRGRRLQFKAISPLSCLWKHFKSFIFIEFNSVEAKKNFTVWFSDLIMLTLLKVRCFWSFLILINWKCCLVLLYLLIYFLVVICFQLDLRKL